MIFPSSFMKAHQLVEELLSQTHRHEAKMIKKLKGNNCVIFSSLLLNEIILMQCTYGLYDDDVHYLIYEGMPVQIFHCPLRVILNFKLPRFGLFLQFLWSQEEADSQGVSSSYMAGTT
jgi:hypothetical protein